MIPMMISLETQTVRVFPLSSVLLLPRNYLPLHIFEPRYRAMVAEALDTDRRIGMVHPKMSLDDDGGEELLPLGCIGEIRACQKLSDGRYHLVLEGVSRMRICEELPIHPGGFRQVEAVIEPDDDRALSESVRWDRERIVTLADSLMPDNYRLDLGAVEQLTDEELVDALSMHVPLSVYDKQALLEVPGGQPRADVLRAALESAEAIRTSAGVSMRRH